MISEYVARNINGPTPPSGFAYGTVVGTNPLDNDDATIGYVEFMRAGPLSIYGDTDEAITFNPELAAGDPVAGTIDNVTIDVGFEVEGPNSLSMFITGILGEFGSITAPTAAQPATWTRYVLPTFPSATDEEYALVVDPDTTWQMRAATPTGNGYQIKRVTYLRIIVEWTPAAGKALRLINRGDSLGMGSGRVVNVGTRQGSVRIFGPH